MPEEGVLIELAGQLNADIIAAHDDDARLVFFLRGVATQVGPCGEVGGQLGGGRGDQPGTGPLRSRKVLDVLARVAEEHQDEGNQQPVDDRLTHDAARPHAEQR
jgi:hypothetical protein